MLGGGRFQAPLEILRRRVVGRGQRRQERGQDRGADQDEADDDRHPPHDAPSARRAGSGRALRHGAPPGWAKICDR